MPYLPKLSYNIEQNMDSIQYFPNNSNQHCCEVSQTCVSWQSERKEIMSLVAKREEYLHYTIYLKLSTNICNALFEKWLQFVTVVLYH